MNELALIDCKATHQEIKQWQVAYQTKKVKSNEYDRTMNSEEAQPTQEDEKSNEDPEESPLLPSIHREAILPLPRLTTVNLLRK